MSDHSYSRNSGRNSGSGGNPIYSHEKSLKKSSNRSTTATAKSLNKMIKKSSTSTATSSTTNLSSSGISSSYNSNNASGSGYKTTFIDNATMFSSAKAGSSNSGGKVDIDPNFINQIFELQQHQHQPSTNNQSTEMDWMNCKAINLGESTIKTSSLELQSKYIGRDLGINKSTPTTIFMNVTPIFSNKNE
ncbi:uncharacterized protein LOC113794860 [Dermatophagoides pteronyssinus]|uniref:uncharacterized protein LOC113794860 n=1 Tax=Dermatophagoides pteronyssinus TaxID=6956 RepID=UPI003F676EFB